MALKLAHTVIAEQRKEISGLHDRLIRMHTVGLEEHIRALEARKAETAIGIEHERKLADKAAGEAPLDVEGILAHDMDKAHAVESFAPARPAKPDPESAVDD